MHFAKIVSFVLASVTVAHSIPVVEESPASIDAMHMVARVAELTPVLTSRANATTVDAESAFKTLAFWLSGILNLTQEVTHAYLADPAVAAAIAAANQTHAVTLSALQLRDEVGDSGVQDETDQDDYGGGAHSSSDSSSASGLAALTAPAVNDVANPLLTGVGRGVAGSANSIVQVTQLLGALTSVLSIDLGNLTAHTANVALANVPSVAQQTIKALDENREILGDVAAL